MVIHMYRDTSAGFRTLSNIMKVLSQYMAVPVMSYNSIKRWMLLYGYHLLKKDKENKEGDNVFINDFSIQLGKEKCLLVLRGSLSQMREQGFNLSHSQVEVVDLRVVKKSDNQLVTASLEWASSKVGRPKQIVSDNGSDIKKGNENFCTNNAGVIYTYDVGHKTACLLKALLESDDQWKSLLLDINKTLILVQQTELSFLRPILPRKKSRYLNISILISWVKNILGFKDRKDFSLIDCDKVYVFNPESFSKICDEYPDKFSYTDILKLTSRTFQDNAEALEAISLIIGSDIKEKDVELINLANKRFYEKFGIFEKYRPLIEDLSVMVTIINNIQYHIKHDGLSMDTMDLIEKSIDFDKLTGEKTKKIYYQLINYLNLELSKFGNDIKPYLNSSDIIESLFGKFKHKLTDKLGSMHSSILFLVVMCGNFNSVDIKQATGYQLKDVQKWFRNMQSDKPMEVKRKEAFSFKTN